jgi:hypothetical protein
VKKIILFGIAVIFYCIAIYAKTAKKAQQTAGSDPVKSSEMKTFK